MTGIEMIKLLKQNGFTVRKVKGSHYHLVKGNKTVVVPHHNVEMGKGLEITILKGAGLK